MNSSPTNIVVKLFLLAFLVGCQSSENTSTESGSTRKEKKDSLTGNRESGKRNTPITTENENPNEAEALEKLPEISHPEAIGLWMVPKEHSLIQKDNIAMIPWQSIFKYDGRFITVQIMFVIGGTPRYPPKWPSKDGFYKLKTAWHGDSLFYHSPFKKTEFLALYADSVFLKTDVYTELSNTWKYKRITAEEVPDYLRPVLYKRKLFNYKLVE